MRARDLAWGVLTAAIAVGCGDSDGGGSGTVAPGDPFMAYNADVGNVTVLGGETSMVAADGGIAPNSTGGDVGETPILVGTAAGSDGEIGEVCLSDTLCEVPNTQSSTWCEREGGPVDLIYVDGVLVETICYPPAEDPERPTEVVETSGDVDVAQNANRTTVIFDPETDGEPIEGDITVDGNNVSIYGNGPDATILDGDVTLDGNNTRLRGVTIMGDLILRKNTVAIVLCKILGNVILETESTNNSVVAENDIFGNFISDSNNNLFVGNDVMGEWTHTGNNNTCDRNAAFTDENEDEIVDPEERGDALTCP